MATITTVGSHRPKQLTLQRLLTGFDHHVVTPYKTSYIESLKEQNNGNYLT